MTTQIEPCALCGNEPKHNSDGSNSWCPNENCKNNGKFSVRFGRIVFEHDEWNDLQRLIKAGKRIQSLEAKLKVAVEALKITFIYGLPPHDCSGYAEWERARAALKEIEK